MSRRAYLKAVLLFCTMSALAPLTASASPMGGGVELSRSTGNHFFVPVQVNHRSAWFAVDTGAALTIMDRDKAKELGLSEQAQVVSLPRQIEVNDRTVPVAQISNLRLGDENLGSGPVALIDLRSFGAKLRDSGRPITMDGILGLDIMQRYHAVIDCRSQRLFMTTSDSGQQAVVAAARSSRLRRVPLRVSRSGALEIEGYLGHNRYSFVVDTGGFTTLLPLKVASQNGVVIMAAGIHAKGIHARPRPVYAAMAPDLVLGSYDLGPTFLGVTALPEGPEDLQYPFGGLIGADFLIDHGGIIDIGNTTLYFK
ncbi:MAG: clan AA aspartic protease [Verrucomicrobia bacterium]|nr:clan AA aspartic protease [Verrucomicrobiota bacterium]